VPIVNATQVVAAVECTATASDYDIGGVAV
jgi:hypothetical protein